MKQLFIPITLCFICFVISNASWANNYSTPEQAVNDYVKAVQTGTSSYIENAFEQTARIQYYNPEGKLLNYSRDEFAKLVNTGNEWAATIEITNMLLTGNVANATVEFTWGENSQHGFVDYLNLINDGESWHIVSKVAQYVER